MSAVLEVMSVRNSAGTDRSPSRPAALLGTVALGVRLAEHWVSKITPKEKRGMGIKRATAHKGLTDNEDSKATRTGQSIRVAFAM